MNDLLLQTRNFVIKFHDGSKKFIDQSQYLLLLEAEANGMQSINFKDGSGSYKFSSIQKYLPLDEYYVQYPKERPQEVPRFEYQPKPIWKHARKVSQIKELIRGYIAGNIEVIGKDGWESKKQRDENYKKMNQRLQELQNKN